MTLNRSWTFPITNCNSKSKITKKVIVKTRPSMLTQGEIKALASDAINDIADILKLYPKN